jgi:enoyl-CoA hydratase/carnithine racemase
MITARRYGGHDALAAGIVDRAVNADAVRAAAIEIAAAQAGKAGDILGAVKTRMYAPALAALRDTSAPA